MVVPNNFNSNTAVLFTDKDKVHTDTKQKEPTVRYTGLSTMVGPPDGTSSMSPFWYLQVWRWLLDFLKICEPKTSRIIKTKC
jgi:hypothetical protein